MELQCLSSQEVTICDRALLSRKAPLCWLNFFSILLCLHTQLLLYLLKSLQLNFSMNFCTVTLLILFPSHGRGVSSSKVLPTRVKQQQLLKHNRINIFPFQSLLTTTEQTVPMTFCILWQILCHILWLSYWCELKFPRFRWGWLIEVKSSHTEDAGQMKITFLSICMDRTISQKVHTHEWWPELWIQNAVRFLANANDLVASPGNAPHKRF